MPDGSVSPLDTRDIDVRGIDFKNVLAKTGETIIDKAVSIAPATGLDFDEADVEVSGKIVSVLLQGGTPGDYVVTVEIETSIGRRLNRSFDITVTDR